MLVTETKCVYPTAECETLNFFPKLLWIEFNPHRQVHNVCVCVNAIYNYYCCCPNGIQKLFIHSDWSYLMQ